MRQDVVITVFGDVRTAEAIGDIVAAAAAEGCIDWERGIGEDEAFAYLCSCSEDGKPFSLTRHDTSDLFDEVVSVCKEYGLSYVMNMGDTGSEGFSAMQSWAPGMPKDFVSSCDDGKVQISLSDVKKAAAKGLEAVNGLVSRLEAMTLSNIEVKRIAVAAEAVEAFLEKEAMSP